MSKREDHDKKEGMSRRDFAKTSVAAGAAAVTLPKGLRADAPAESSAAASTSTYGRRHPATPPPETLGYGGGDIRQPAAVPAKADKSYPNGWKEGTTIPAEYYLDERHHAADERFLADNVWFYVDHESRIPNPGDYFVFEFGRQESILIVRNKAGEIKGFHNVCRHRGSRLCRHDADSIPSDDRLSVRQLGQSGSTPVFRCPLSCLDL